MTTVVRIAAPDDAATAARLLIAFNTEYDDPAPEASWLTARVADLVRAGETDVLLVEANGEAVGLAVQRYRPSLWEPAAECYLAELYVAPAQRGAGLGRRLLLAAMDRASERGATYMDLTTTNRDEAAVALYESVGFDRHERGGPEVESYYFEIDLPSPRTA